tara:strand:- start:3869 stop:4066 length:198 start_codon:yes stop_codon:yes gene_type:complete
MLTIDIIENTIKKSTIAHINKMEADEIHVLSLEIFYTLKNLAQPVGSLFDPDKENDSRAVPIIEK